jgi:hypothetical protein
MRKQHRNTAENAPPGRDLPFYAEIQQMIEIVYLGVKLGAIQVLHIAAEMAMARLIPVPNGNGPKLRIVVIVSAASRFR